MTTVWNWPGARWWRCDLHLHTPASHDFRDKDATALEWVERAVAAGLDVVAITDHDNAGFITEARRVADERLTVLAGVEITSSEGVHLLVVLGDDASEDQIKELLSACEVPSADWGTGPARANKPLLDCVEIAGSDKFGGICIVAHADAEATDENPSSASLLRASLDQTTRRKVLASPALAAVEVCGSDPGEHEQLRGVGPRGVGRREPGLPLVRFSDAHGLDDIGRRSTWIKMTSPDHAGLRLALSDGARSVLDPATVAEPNDVPAHAIEAIEIREAKFLGRSGPLRIEFNPWFTSVIGGRGAGKSSVVHLLRAALGRETPSGQVGETYGRFVKVGRRGEDGALTDQTQIVVTYRKDGATFRALWATGAEAPSLEERRGDEWVPAEGRAISRLPVQILSQGEIHEIARNAGALLGIVDQAASVTRTDWQRDFDAEFSRFLALRAQGRQAGAQLVDEAETRGELEDVMRGITVFEAEEHRATLQEYRRRSRQRREVDRFAAEVRATAADLRRAGGSQTSAPPAADVFNDAAGDQGALGDIAALARAEEETASAVIDLAEKLEQAANSFDESVAGSAWHVAVGEADAGYRSLVEALTASGVEGPGRYAELVERRDALEARLSDLGAQRQKVSDLAAEDKSSLETLHELRSDLTQRRERFLVELLSDSKLVRIEVDALGENADLEDTVRELVGVENGFDQDIAMLVGLIPTDAARGDGIRAFKERVRAIIETADIPDLADARFRGRLTRLNEEQLDRLDAWFPEDRLVPSYSRDDGQFQPLSQGSAGQQNAAILAFLLSHGSEPIVIDQPENDLDNSLITDLVVAQLREIHPRRQVVVVTHNPNIVVNGDADLVLALKVPSGEVLVDVCGGLQEESIRSAICDVMEGGRTAFEIRYSRIGERSSAR